MEFIIKNEYNNGEQDLLEIYHTTNKIKEVEHFSYIDEVVKVNEETGEEYIDEEEISGENIILWDTSEESPIIISKSRKEDYSVSDELVEVKENAISEVSEQESIPEEC